MKVGLSPTNEVEKEDILTMQNLKKIIVDQDTPTLRPQGSDKEILKSLRTRHIKTRQKSNHHKRLRHIRKYTYFVLLPDDPFKIYWEMFIMVLLTMTFIVTPYKLSFLEYEDPWMVYVDIIIDFFFGVDIFLNFFMAFYDPRYILVDTRKVSKSLRTLFLSPFFTTLNHAFLTLLENCYQVSNYVVSD